MKTVKHLLSAAALALGLAGGAQAADIVLVVDESGSMGGEHAWLPGMITSLEAELVTAGETSNTYSLVGFGGTSGTLGHLLLDAGTVTDFVSATSSLITSGGFEDGWSAMHYALDNVSFTSDVRNVILVTDEDRDNGNAAYTYANTLDALNNSGTQGATLNAVVNGYYNSDAGSALGTNGTDAYIADGMGDYTTANFTGYGTAFGTTHADYSDMALATGGAAWNLNFLRAGGLTADSFTAAFVDIKVSEVITPVPEPGALALLAVGLIGIGATRVRKMKA